MGTTFETVAKYLTDRTLSNSMFSYAGVYNANTMMFTKNESVSVQDLNIRDPQLNTSSSDSEQPSKEALVLLSMLFCIIGIIGLIGNSLVIIVILLDRKMRHSVTNIFIMNLATADFLIMLIGVPEIVQFMLNRGWLLGEAFCKVNRFVLVVSLYVSVLSLVSVCIERFVAIVYPLKAHILCGRRKVMFATILIWPISIICGLPTVLLNRVAYPHSLVVYKHCIIVFPKRQFHQIFQFLEFGLFYFIPVIVQIILYAVIGRKLYASTEELHARCHMRKDKKYKPERSSDTIKARKDVVKMLVASVLVYIICYAPPQVLIFYESFTLEPFSYPWSFRVFSIVISNVNSAANPILYSIFSQNFRNNFKKYLCYFCLLKMHVYQGAIQESSESRILTRNVSSTNSRTTRFSRV